MTEDSDILEIYVVEAFAQSADTGSKNFASDKVDFRMSLSDSGSGFSHAAADFKNQWIIISECLNRIELLIGVIGNFVQWKKLFQSLFLGVADMSAAHAEAADVTFFQFFNLFGGQRFG